MTEKLRNIEAAWSDVFLKKKKRVFHIKVLNTVNTVIWQFFKIERQKHNTNNSLVFFTHVALVME